MLFLFYYYNYYSISNINITVFLLVIITGIIIVTNTNVVVLSIIAGIYFVLYGFIYLFSYCCLSPEYLAVCHSFLILKAASGTGMRAS